MTDTVRPLQWVDRHEFLGRDWKAGRRCGSVRLRGAPQLTRDPQETSRDPDPRRAAADADRPLRPRTGDAVLVRVFLSSTSELRDHRERVRDAILRLGQLPVQMETFGAVPGEPVEMCCRKAAASDVVVVLVGPRFGFVPESSDGGDGYRSISWLEVAAAAAAGRPVFAFVPADPVDEESAVTKFRAYLQRKYVVDRYQTPDDLAGRVASSIASWLLTRTPTRPAQPWTPRVEHPLQPALHFRGRREVLERLEAWWADPCASTRIVSLIAGGGWGKTAVAERFLAGIRKDTLAGGLFVWSFYENPRTEEFLLRACEYFAGRVPKEAQGQLQHLQEVLADGCPHLLVLDGIELIQQEGRAARELGGLAAIQREHEAASTHGTLKDPLIKLLLRSIADGAGRARAIITSRFPLPDLRPWEGDGQRHLPISLDSLDEAAAVAMLRAWGVKGEDRELVALVRQLGGHALSIAVLGSYLGDVRGGDLAAAAELDLGRTAEDDPLAAKLARVLAHYARALSADERDLLAVLSTLPRGSDASTLTTLLDRTRLGSLAGELQPRPDGSGAEREHRRRAPRPSPVAADLDQLRRRGLVFVYRQARSEDPMAPPATVYTAHPFVRDYFRNLVDGEAVNRSMADLIRPTLSLRPGSLPRTQAALDRLEQLIEHLCLAGDATAAGNVYQYSLGGYRHLAQLGEFVRGRRLLELVCGGDTPETARGGYDLLSELGHYAQDLGELHLAQGFFDAARAHFVQDTMTLGDLCAEIDDFAALYLKRGLLPRAAEPLSFCAGLAITWPPFLRFLRGDDLSLEVHAPEAALYAPQILAAGWGVATRRSLRRAFPAAGKSPQRWLLAGQLALPDRPEKARAALSRVRTWTSSTGHVQTILAAHHLAARIALDNGELTTCVEEGSRGMRIADACGFGILATDLRLVVAAAHVAAGRAAAAQPLAEEALAHAADEQCGYAWGAADAWHLLGFSFRAQLDGRAQDALLAACELRRRLGHPGLRQSMALLPPRRGGWSRAP